MAKQLICDICGRECQPSGRFELIYKCIWKIEKQDICYDCISKLSKMILDKK